MEQMYGKTNLRSSDIFKTNTGTKALHRTGQREAKGAQDQLSKSALNVS